MWNATPAEWSVIVEGFSEQRRDRLIAAGIVAATVVQVNGGEATALDFVDGKRDKPDTFAVIAQARAAAQERARAEWEEWWRGLVSRALG